MIKTAQNFSLKAHAFEKKENKGFTLVELLVVIAIIAILAAVVAILINPLELTRRGRDSTRLTDLTNLQQAINVTLEENSSTPGVLCNGALTLAACQTAQQDNTKNKSSSGTRVTTGTGWVSVNISTQTAISIPTLPIDPTNTGNYRYTYCTDDAASNPTYEIDARLESAQYAPATPGTNNDKISTDGGNDTALYEVGTNLSLIAPSGGICLF